MPPFAAPIAGARTTECVNYLRMAHVKIVRMLFYRQPSAWPMVASVMVSRKIHAVAFVIYQHANACQNHNLQFIR